MAYQTIDFHPGPRVSTIILNRPPLNIINLQMMDELNAVWDEVEAMETSIVVITAAGDRGFSAGVEIADHVAKTAPEMLSRFHRLIRRIFHTNRITMAVLHGLALGGGAELAMVCDFVFAASGTQLGLPEISLACFPPVAAAYLPRAVGFHRATQWILLGEPISAEDAERAGLVTRTATRDELRSIVDQYVDRLLMKSTAAVALTKKALREGLEHRFESALAHAEEIYLEQLLQTEDMNEGIQAFLQKRPPSWNNR